MFYLRKKFHLLDLAEEICLIQACRNPCSNLASSSHPQDAKATLLIFKLERIISHPRAQMAVEIRANLAHTVELLNHGPLAARAPEDHGTNSAMLWCRISQLSFLDLTCHVIVGFDYTKKIAERDNLLYKHRILLHFKKTGLLTGSAL